MRRSRRMVGGLVAVLAVAGAAVSAGDVGAELAPPSSDGWITAGDDAVVRYLDGSPISGRGAVGPRTSGPGFNTFSGVDRNQAAYMFRLVAGPEIEQYRDDVVGVAADLAAATGGAYTVAAGTIADREPTDGEIVIRVVSTSPCGSLVSGGAIGCGGPNVMGSRAVNGQVWLSTDLDEYSGVIEYAVIAHEIGHAVGLDHFNQEYEGQYQVMRSYSAEDLDTYRSGDINGLEFLFPPPAPANDQFAAATVLPVPAGTREGTTTSATAQAGEPDHGGDGVSVWYRFTAPSAGRLVLSAEGEDGYAWLATYTGSAVGALTEVVPAASDWFANGTWQAATIGSGATYRIAVDSWGETDFTLDHRFFGCDGTRFSDVSAGNPFCIDITWMADDEISTGYPDGTFRPGDAVTRGTMAAFLYRAAGSPTVAPDSSFSDVPSTHPFADAIAWMVDEGITGGYSDGTFRPGSPISRQGMAAFMYRMAGEPSISPYEDAVFFWDVLPSHAFHDEIVWMYLADITTGYSDHSFRPAGIVNRGGLSAFLFRSTVYG